MATGTATATAIRATCPRLPSSTAAEVRRAVRSDASRSHASRSGTATGRAAATFATRLPLPTNRRLASLASLTYLRTRGAAAVGLAAVDHAVVTREVMRAVTNLGVVGHGVTMRAAATIRAATIRAAAMSGLRRPV